jgi:hypothetical protein
MVPRRRCGLLSTPTQVPHLGLQALEAQALGCTLGCVHETIAPDTADPWGAKALDLERWGRVSGWDVRPPSSHQERHLDNAVNSNPWTTSAPFFRMINIPLNS